MNTPRFSKAICQTGANIDRTSTKPSQTPNSLGPVSQATSSTVSSVTSSPATYRSTTPAPSNVTTPDCTTQASPVDYNHPPISQPVMPHCTGDYDLNCVEPDVTFHHQLELQANHDEGKASQRGPISDTITPTSESTTLQLEQPLSRTLPRPLQRSADVLDPARLRDAVLQGETSRLLDCRRRVRMVRSASFGG